ncbi:MAG: DUF3482 domain-containing protein [Planctomycetes bacterium]|nr:DUF3482 domain-containing protein [Planctomycetota bacterium]
MADGATTVTLAVVSHTNVGKTTLVRTLLRRDVGEVLDQAHVTTVSTAYPLLDADGARLVLEDTPGFGDSARLLRRLGAEGNPLGWFLHQVWDRLRDRPLWCAQEAVRTVRERADVVLYLVNASEAPGDAGYVAPEMQILSWAARPVVVVLNQTGPRPEPALEQAWRDAVRTVGVVRDVLPLDAFTRCWAQERTLLTKAVALVPQGKRPAAQALLAAWDARAAQSLRRSAAALAADLVAAAADREPLPVGAGRGEKAKAMEALAQRRTAATRALVAALLEAHGLDGASAAVVEDRLEDFAVREAKSPDAKKGALWGGLVSGALSGLAADLAAGGLTFGGGAVVGAILGALGGAGLAKGYALAVRGTQPSVAWAPDALARLARGAVARYVAVAHFGRGRGGWRDVELPADLASHVAATSAAHERGLHAALAAAAVADVERAVEAWLRDILARLCPDQAPWLLRPAG